MDSRSSAARGERRLADLRLFEIIAATLYGYGYDAFSAESLRRCFTEFQKDLGRTFSANEIAEALMTMEVYHILNKAEPDGDGTSFRLQREKRIFLALCAFLSRSEVLPRFEYIFFSMGTRLRALQDEALFAQVMESRISER